VVLHVVPEDSLSTRGPAAVELGLRRNLLPRGHKGSGGGVAAGLPLLAVDGPVPVPGTHAASWLGLLRNVMALVCPQLALALVELQFSTTGSREPWGRLRPVFRHVTSLSVCFLNTTGWQR